VTNAVDGPVVLVAPVEPGADRPWYRHARAEVVALGLIVWLSGIGLLLTEPDLDVALRAGAVWAFVVSVALFAVFEYVVFDVEFIREGIVFTMSEIPLALTLVYLSPIMAVVARLCLSVIVLVVFRRNRGIKLFFNLGIYVLDTTLSIMALRLMLEWWGEGNAALLSGVIIAMAFSSFITSIVIALAIARYEGGTRQRIASEIQSSWWLYPVSSVLAAMTLALMLIEPVLGLFAALPIGAIWLMAVMFGRRQQTLRNLEALHGFAGMLGRTLDAHEIGELAAAEVERLMRSAGACIVRFGDDDEVVTHRSGVVPFRLPASADDEHWRPFLDDHEISTLTARQLTSDGTVREGVRRSALVAPLVDDGQTFGMVAVYQRDKLASDFGPSDRARLRSIVEQLAVSLRRAILHERLEYEARHDSLTGLPARSLFERYVADALDEPSGRWAVIMLDLDRFKEVNDTLGHHAGDALLIEFSRRMSSLLGPDDVLARLAGDEFAILCHRNDPEGFAEMASECLAEGGRPVTLDGLEIVVTVSVGVAEVTALDDSALQPMRRADIAMYNAKWQRTGVELYRDEIDRRTPARLSMLGDLRAAIEGNELDVVFQPKLDLVTGLLVGAEALVRWEHESRGFVAPAEFVRVAEDTGLIKELTDLVLARGIAALSSFNEMGLQLGLAVNLSTHDLFDARLPDRVRGYLATNGVAADQLTLEITESSLLIDAPRTRATINDLHAVGLRLAVDDFGTGYSSLSYLRRLPVHELKIDQSFVSGMLSDPQDEVIVRSTVDLGHNLGLRVVAEGVEDRACLDRLREIGCDVAQGYAISRPLTFDELPDWVRGIRAFTGAPLDWVAATSD
jgi:diguanylate cyclase (GGDEF)-like protein